MRYRVRHLAEYAALRVVAWVLNRLPYRLALAAAWPLAWLAHRAVGFRARAARSRIRQVFGDGLPPREVGRTAWRSWRGVVFTAVETLRLPRVTPSWMARVSESTAFVDAVRRHAATGRGAVLACPHSGSWELAAVTCRMAGIPIFSVAARQKNPLADAYLNRLRESPGIPSVARGSGTLREVIRRLRAGEMLAILPDVRAAEGGIPVPFLSGTASIGRGMASFARHAGVPVIPCMAIRQGWARHSILVWDPVWPDDTLDRDADVARITQAVMQILDTAIRRSPEQWFWFNKRWVLDPV